jgi:hypothetical protein
MGCDTTSAFFRRGKKSAWEAWNCYPDVWHTFTYLHGTPPFHKNLRLKMKISNC